MSVTGSAEDIAKRLGLSSSHITQFMDGEVVTMEVDASNDKDLSLIVVALLEANIDDVWKFLEEEKMADIQEATLSTGNIDTSGDFNVNDIDLTEDICKQLSKNPFLSKEEAKKFKDGVKHGGGVEIYKKILQDRAKTYWDKGLDGIVAYDGKGRDPAKDLKAARNVALDILRNPKMRDEIQVIPSKSDHPKCHMLQWAMQEGNGQAAPVLDHCIRENFGSEVGILSIRERFYCGTNYDAAYILAGVVPTECGTKSVVFYTNHTYSPAVAGFGGSAKRSIGRKMMKGKLVDTMKKGQATFAKK